MPVQVLKEKNASKIGVVKLGATAADGGSRKIVYEVGGETGLPYLHYEGDTPNKTIVAMEVFDRNPEEWCDELKSAFAGVLDNPVAWAKKCVEEFGAEMIYLRVQSMDPDYGGKSVEDCIKLVKEVLAAIDVPLAVVGCGNNELDIQLLPAIADACAGENLLIGNANQDTYSKIVPACIGGKHTLIGQAPLDINICKQLNILMTSEMNMPVDRIVIDPTVGGLGYGIEYAYSILERGRIGALQGDKMLAFPVIGQVGYEAWRAKEANADESEFPKWGDAVERGILWEAVTASALVQAGIDILVLRHPEAVKMLKKNIDNLMVPSVL